jgi:hypothetical protein
MDTNVGCQAKLFRQIFLKNWSSDISPTFQQYNNVYSFNNIMAS